MLNTSVSPALARRLRALRARIAASAIPPSAPGSHLKIATWNIPEFGRRPSRPESLLYIAEVRSLLGPTWRGIADLFPPSVGELAFTFELSDRLPRWVQLSTRDSPEARDAAGLT